jgi:hypothetical protein
LPVAHASADTMSQMPPKYTTMTATPAA